MKDENRMKVRALLESLGLSIADLSRVIGVSRPLASRILGGDPNLNADKFFSRIEQNLPAIVAARRRPFLTIPSVSVAVVETAFRRDAA